MSLPGNMPSDEDTRELSTISCEPCRHKKRKCDRKYPSCSLCINSGTVCNYPERGKRGMPVGYIVSLEKRMIEVEAALFQVYADYQQYREGLNVTPCSVQGIVNALEAYYSTLTKQEKIAEWDQQDLIRQWSRWEWWRLRNEKLNVGIDLHLTHDDILRREQENQLRYERLNTIQQNNPSTSNQSIPPNNFINNTEVPEFGTFPRPDNEFLHEDPSMAQTFSTLDMDQRYKYF